MKLQVIKKDKLACYSLIFLNEFRHRRIKYACNECDYSAARQDKLKRHIEVKHRRAKIEMPAAEEGSHGAVVFPAPSATDVAAVNMPVSEPTGISLHNNAGDNVSPMPVESSSRYFATMLMSTGQPVSLD